MYGDLCSLQPVSLVSVLGWGSEGHHCGMEAQRVLVRPINSVLLNPYTERVRDTLIFVIDTC